MMTQLICFRTLALVEQLPPNFFFLLAAGRLNGRFHGTASLPLHGFPSFPPPGGVLFFFLDYPFPELNWEYSSDPTAFFFDGWVPLASLLFSREPDLVSTLIEPKKPRLVVESKVFLL